MQFTNVDFIASDIKGIRTMTAFGISSCTYIDLMLEKCERFGICLLLLLVESRANGTSKRISAPKVRCTLTPYVEAGSYTY